MADNYSIQPKEKTSFTIDKNLYDDLNNYANVNKVTKSKIINEVLFNFFKGKILTNTYLPNKAGLIFKIPLDLKVKHNCIKNKTVLNSDNAITNFALITVNQIPNNLDVYTTSKDNTAGTFKANKEGVLHCGVDFIFIPDVIRKPTKPNNTFDIDVLDCLYIFYFEVKEDNIIEVLLINPSDAVNKLTNADNIYGADKLIEKIQLLEAEQQQLKYEYEKEMININKGKEANREKRAYNILDSYFILLEMDLLKNNDILNKFNNNNIRVD